MRAPVQEGAVTPSRSPEDPGTPFAGDVQGAELWHSFGASSWRWAWGPGVDRGSRVWGLMCTNIGGRLGEGVVNRSWSPTGGPASVGAGGQSQKPG